MREYGIVSPRFWIGNTGRTLRGDQPAQVLALYLITGPHSSMTGLFYCPVTYMAQETGLTMQGASKALRRLIDAGFCSYDEACEWVFVHTMVRWQMGAAIKPGDRRLVKIKRDIESVPSNKLRAMFIKLHGEAFSIAIDTSVDQDQDQDQDHSGIEGAYNAPSTPHVKYTQAGGNKELDCPEDFEAIWKEYPKRSGGNPKQAGYKAWRSRVRESKVTAADALQAVLNYRAYCEHTGKVGQETVMQFATFFGPQKEGYLQDWSLPKTEKELQAEKARADWQEKVRKTQERIAQMEAM